MNLYGFIDAWKAEFGTERLCRVLRVPSSSYYDWNRDGRDRHARRGEARAELVSKIRAVHDASAETYGSPRVHAELVESGIAVSERRVAALMAAEGIVGLSGREHTTTTTRRDRLAAPFPDLVGRRFCPDRPDVVWYGDVTYIWLAGRFWYLATVLDAATKELIGWSLADHMRTELVTGALHAAVRRRGGRIPVGVIFHSDRGSQYTSSEFGRVCALYKIRQSMGRRGVCFDNAAAESFFATLKRELVDRYHWKSVEQFRSGLFVWINSWYNSRRRHSTIGYLSPMQADQEYRRSMRAA